ncbi:MAG TPA: hypothetical protein VMU34_11040, partial [Mycobacterium sp.]|nr:hypothetical protein [Mycobacterium sp.]
ENCAQACYDCLLSYANQWDHQDLDRHNATELLQQLTHAAVAVGAGGEDRPTQLARLKQLSNSLEQHFLDLLEEHGYRLPDDAQQLVDGYYVRPDFTYHTGGMDVAVFIDGSIHDTTHQHEKDDQARMKLEDEAGWLVLRLHHADADDGWLAAIAANTDIFGPGRHDA